MREAAIVNDQSNFYGKFGEIVEETENKLKHMLQLDGIKQ